MQPAAAISPLRPLLSLVSIIEVLEGLVNRVPNEADAPLQAGLPELLSDERALAAAVRGGLGQMEQFTVRKRIDGLVDRILGVRDSWLVRGVPLYGLIWTALVALAPKLPGRVAVVRQSADSEVFLMICGMHNFSGRGTFSVVFPGYSRQAPYKVAVKEISKHSSRVSEADLRELVVREVKIQGGIDHPGVLRLLATQWSTDSREEFLARLVVDWCPCTLTDVLKSLPNCVMTPELAWKHIRCIVFSYWALQSKGILHRDLKPDNILYSDVGSQEPKIADFGMSRELRQGLAETQVGSPLYMAPEVLSNSVYNNKCDVWSVGIIFYKMIVGSTPYDEAKSWFALETAIRDADPMSRASKVVMCDDIRALLSRMLERDPTLRISWEELYDKVDVERHIAKYERFSKVKPAQQYTFEDICKILENEDMDRAAANARNSSSISLPEPQDYEELLRNFELIQIQARLAKNQLEKEKDDLLVRLAAATSACAEAERRAESVVLESELRLEECVRAAVAEAELRAEERLRATVLRDEALTAAARATEEVERRMEERLHAAVAEAELRTERSMLADSVKAYVDLENLLSEREQDLARTKQQLVESQRRLQEREGNLAQTKQQLTASDRRLQECEQELALTKQQLDASDRVVAKLIELNCPHIEEVKLSATDKKDSRSLFRTPIFRKY